MRDKFHDMFAITRQARDVKMLAHATDVPTIGRRRAGADSGIARSSYTNDSVHRLFTQTSHLPIIVMTLFTMCLVANGTPVAKLLSLVECLLSPLQLCGPPDNS